MKFKQLITKIFSLFKKFFLSIRLHCHVEAIFGSKDVKDNENDIECEDSLKKGD